ncbi:hypothetical protein M5X04_12260 [Paenibacillus alvei]|uniref:Uncharacterized protein n=2 Tax=Paenibacillus TaxID=44249 RepID=A0ABT4E900_PAEAL|nr:hypothetical protein [Paenibacillus alvei]MCY9530095.1 hypothetical protein [Paenibacillus alvei]
MLPDTIFVCKIVAFRLIRASFICPASNRKIQENKKEKILSPGDVILLEIQIGYNGGPWLPIETLPAEFDAIQYATSLGIVFVPFKYKLTPSLASSTYVQGDIVSYNGVKYQAK